MKKSYENCLETNQLKKIDPAKHLAEKELKEAEFDLKEAKKSFENNNYKWPVIESYYCCFHIARALLFLVGIKEKSHFCAYAALSTIFEEHFSKEELDNYKKNIQKRELADYHGTYSKEETKSSIEFAERFLKKSIELHNKLKNLDLKTLKKIRDSTSLKFLEGENENQSNNLRL